MNPYEEALSIIGSTMEVFEEDREIPCFGFGDGEDTVIFYSRSFFFRTNISLF